jgi:hypothetical protein
LAMVLSPLILSHLNVILFRPFYDSFQRKANCRDMSSQLEIFVRALSRLLGWI